MIKYGELVDYIKRNHINWNTDLFDVLKGFFDEYHPPSHPNLPLPAPSYHQNAVFPHIEDFIPPEDGEYSSEDLLNLFST